MTGLSVSGDDLGKLIPFSISICHWLKDVSPLRAAESLVKPLQGERKVNVENCFKQVIASIENAEFELTNAQIKYILSQYDVDTWALALKAIISKGRNPSVLDERTKSDLVEWAYYFVKEGGGDWNELFVEAGKLLAKLGHKGFQAFGEFCSLIRDCSQTSGADVIAANVSADIFFSGKVNSHRRDAAGKLFEKLVSESERLFGQSGSSVGTVSFGIRSKNEVTQWNMVHFLPPEKKARQDLRTFYAYIDKKFVGIVDELFEYHSFETIAEAINNKYGMIPAPWKSKLKKMKYDGNEGLEWFDYATVKTPTPGASKNTRKKVSEPISSKHPTRNDKIIDVLIDGEVNYYRRLSGLAKLYVKHLLQVASSTEPNRANCLMLNTHEIDFMFGLRFQKILDLSHSLLTGLEVINLSRRSLRGEITREQILAKVLTEMARTELVSAYSSYSSTYPEVMDLLKRKRMQKKYLVQNGMRKRHPDLFDVWLLDRKQMPSLVDKHLEEVMELPVKRIHTYREAVKQLLRNCRSNTAVYNELLESYNSLKRAAEALTKLSEKSALRMKQQ